MTDNTTGGGESSLDRSALPEDSTNTTDRELLRILLVEDDDADALLVGAHLDDAESSVRLERTRTLSDALGRLDVDCVLLDLDLPDAPGLSALRLLLDAGAPAVVVLTGPHDLDSGLLAVAAGAQDHLIRGEVDGDLLRRSVRYAVQRRQLQAADRALYRSWVRARETTRFERALLPRPAVTDDRVEILVGYRAGRDSVLGGDFYDVVQRPDGTVLALIGDVCGHGPDEAALGAVLRTAWRTLVLAGTSTGELFPLLEQMLISERAHEEVFTTAAMLRVDADRAVVDLYLAGHPVPLLLADPASGHPATAALPAPCRGPALGLPLQGRWFPHRLELGDHWRLMMYTDGLLEATLVGDDTKRIGEVGLLEVVDAALTTTKDAVVEEVLHQVRSLHGGELADDTAVVVVGT